MYVCLLVPSANETQNTRFSSLFQLFAWVKEFNIRKSTWYRFLPLRLVNESLETETAWVLKGFPCKWWVALEGYCLEGRRRMLHIGWTRPQDTPRYFTQWKTQARKYPLSHPHSSSFAQTWWCFLLLINMKTHKTFDGVENHRRCLLCLKWASGNGRRKNEKLAERDESRNLMIIRLTWMSKMWVSV